MNLESLLAEESLLPLKLRGANKELDVCLCVRNGNLHPSFGLGLVLMGQGKLLFQKTKEVCIILVSCVCVCVHIVYMCVKSQV